MSDKVTTIETLKEKVKKFIIDRSWEPYNCPKNLSMNISVEAAELMEIFMWTRSADETASILKSKREEIENEVADVGFALLNFCWANNIDLSEAMEKKMPLNAKKYPIIESDDKHK